MTKRNPIMYMRVMCMCESRMCMRRRALVMESVSA